MVELPDYLASGEFARLIPVIADTRKEQRATSVFLATLSAVPDFAQTLFATAGQRLGKRSVIDTFTEVVFKDSTDSARDRPDGLVRVTTGKRSWSALLEAKIGSATLDAQQVEKYLQLARDNSIDAVITISNQFAPRPEHGPVEVSKALTRKVSVFHWSWSSILTEAILLQTKNVISDPEQAFILREFVRFLSHDSIGVTGFDRMPSEWKTVIGQVKSGASLKRSSPEIESIVSAWQQESRDLSLRMSRHLAVTVEQKLNRAHVASAEARFRDNCTQLASECELEAEYQIPNAASALRVLVGLKTQTIRVGMEINAPLDRRTASARLNWLIRQLKDAGDKGILVRIPGPRRSSDFICSLDDLMLDPKEVADGLGQPPRSFEVFRITDDGRRFSGRNTFIEEIEKAVPYFYDHVGQHLQQWVPKPPKPIDVPTEAVAEKEKPTPVSKPQQANEQPAGQAPISPSPGNDHTSLIEMPSFLRRFRM